MNILHLHTGLNLTCGISKTIFLIAKYPEENCRHFVLALNGDADGKFKEAGINVGFIKSKSTAGIFLFLGKYIKENKIDIIHSHHRYADYLSYLVSFLYKVKRVTSVQSFVYGKKSLSYKSPVLLAAGESVKNHLVSYFRVNESRIKIFNNFVDLNECQNLKNRDEMLAELGIVKDKFVFGYIGRFSVKEKGIDVLVDAFCRFKERHPEAELFMAGNGDDINNINIPCNVKIINAAKNIFDYYNILDCIILPSRVDPFPLTVLESGMMKIPFIGSNVNGISEIIEDNINGLLFEKENTDMLVEKMEVMFADRKFANQCANNLYTKICDNYTCEKSLKKLYVIYKNL